MEPWLQVLVALAAILYITDRFSTMFARAIRRDIVVVLDKIDRLHQVSGETIKPTFELWWENKRDAVSAIVTRDILKDIDEQIPGGMPEEMRDIATRALSNSLFDILKVDAFHLAVHAHMGDKDLELIRKLPKKARGPHEETRKEHMKELEGTEVTLLQYGITAEEIREQFAQAK